MVFDYCAKWIVKDFEILDLPTLYHRKKNHCIINAFHGDCDNLITLEKKREFCHSINNCFFK